VGEGEEDSLSKPSAVKEGAPMPEKFTWILSTALYQGISMMDEFIADGFRVMLRGGRLELSFEAPGSSSSDAARALADKYVAVLGKHLVVPPFLMTEEEFSKRTTPPFGGNLVMTNRTLGIAWEEHGQIARAIRAARGELLAGADESLRRCYDFLQEAREEMTKLDGKPAYPVYKAMEVLEEQFDDSEANAVKALGAVFKQTKRTANEERHIQKKDQPGAKNSRRSVELARETIRAYERYLLNRP
jgi:hypothetical protein